MFIVLDFVKFRNCLTNIITVFNLAVPTVLVSLVVDRLKLFIKGEKVYLFFKN